MSFFDRNGAGACNAGEAVLVGLEILDANRQPRDLVGRTFAYAILDRDHVERHFAEATLSDDGKRAVAILPGDKTTELAGLIGLEHFWIEATLEGRVDWLRAGLTITKGGAGIVSPIEPGVSIWQTGDGGVTRTVSLGAPGRPAWDGQSREEYDLAQAARVPAVPYTLPGFSASRSDRERGAERSSVLEEVAPGDSGIGPAITRAWSAGRVARLSRSSLMLSTGLAIVPDSTLRGEPGTTLTRTGGTTNTLSNDYAGPAMRLRLSEVTLALGDTTASGHVTGRLADSRFERVGMVGGNSTGLGYNVVSNDGLWIDCTISRPTNITGTGAYRISGGARNYFFRCTAVVGDDGLQAVMGANPNGAGGAFNVPIEEAIWTDCRNVVGGRVMTVSIDVANSKGIKTAGWVRCSGRGIYYGGLIETRSHYSYPAMLSRRDGQTMRVILTRLTPRGHQQFSRAAIDDPLTLSSSGDSTWDVGSLLFDSVGNASRGGNGITLAYEDLGGGIGRITQNDGSFIDQGFLIGDGVCIPTNGRIAHPNKGKCGIILGFANNGLSMDVQVFDASGNPSSFVTIAADGNTVVTNRNTYRKASTAPAGTAPTGLRVKRTNPAIFEDIIVDNDELDDSAGTWVTCQMIRGPGILRPGGTMTVKNVRKSALRAYGRCRLPDYKIVSPHTPSDGSLPVLTFKDVIDSEVPFDIVAPGPGATAAAAIQVGPIAVAPGDDPAGDGGDDYDSDLQDSLAFARNLRLGGRRGGVIRAIQPGKLGMLLKGGTPTEPIYVDGVRFESADRANPGKAIRVQADSYVVIVGCDFIPLGVTTLANQLQIDAGATVVIADGNLGLMRDSDTIAALKLAVAAPTAAYLDAPFATTSQPLADVGIGVPLEANALYHITGIVRWRSALTTTGAGFSLNGPAASHVEFRIANTVAANNTPQFRNSRAWLDRGVTASVDVADADLIATIVGLVRTTATGSLRLYAASEDGGQITVMPDTYIEATRKR